MTRTMIKQCSCHSAYQDTAYGLGNRVHNLSKKDEPKCSVCSLTAFQRRMAAHAAQWKPMHGGRA